MTDLATYKSTANLVQPDTPTRVSILLLGLSGSGKTWCAATAPKPILLDCFDPSGYLSIRDQIGPDLLVQDWSVARDNPKKPSVWRDWVSEFDSRSKLWPELGTYVLDSATTWGEACLNFALNGHPITKPNTEHWVAQRALMEGFLKRMLSLPCHVVVTGHLQTKEDQKTGSKWNQMLITGQSAQRVPLLFDELWIAESKPGPKDTTYQIRTKPSFDVEARSRLSAGGKLATYEPPNITQILTKAGINPNRKETQNG